MTHPESGQEFAEHEAELAWYLAEAHRDCLAETGATMVFVNLGAGDHVDVIRDVLLAIATAGGTVSTETADRVHAWIESYNQHEEFRPLLAAVQR